MSTKQPSDIPASLVSLVTSTNGLNFSLLTSVILYVATQAVQQLQNKSPMQNSPSIEIFKHLIISLDAEGRYYLFNVMANQLRYPNSHTHYFSCVMLWLFVEADNEFLQEQITRVLLERLIVHRPHPVSFKSILTNL
jgi:CCR4-NOT transcription complex subunit 1